MNAALLEVRGLTKKFGGVTALDGIDLAVDRGEILGLIGPNGSGKTTLFNVVTGIYGADAGVIRFEGAAADYGDATIAVATAESMVPATTVVTASSMEGLFAAPRRAHWAGASLGRGRHPQY